MLAACAKCLLQGSPLIVLIVRWAPRPHTHSLTHCNQSLKAVRRPAQPADTACFWLRPWGCTVGPRVVCLVSDGGCAHGAWAWAWGKGAASRHGGFTLPAACIEGRINGWMRDEAPRGTDSIESDDSCCCLQHLRGPTHTPPAAAHTQPDALPAVTVCCLFRPPSL